MNTKKKANVSEHPRNVAKLHKPLPPNRHDPETRWPGWRHNSNACQRTQIQNLSSKLLEAKRWREEAVENDDNTAAKRMESIIQQSGANKLKHG